MNQDEKKQKAAKAAFDLVFPSLHEDSVLGIGTGSTTNFFIEELNKSNAHIKGAICSSNASKQNLKESGIEVLELNDVHGIDIYIDGADEFNSRFELIKGGGGALTREKILANSSKHFICIVDDSKHVQLLGEFPLAIEVLEVARSAVSREMMRMGGRPVYRTNFRTDNGNQIIDVSNLKIEVPFEMEAAINNIPGVVENGIFANRTPDIILKATESGIEEIKK
jgi:ribose 5-phosphate isomerase A